ncbi:nucleotidyltransferase domain-containing protein [Clostridium carnis]
MGKAVIEYQKAYKEITDGLRKNKNIIGILVFGSMVTGDLWAESDIDLFVICKDDFSKVRDVYSEVNDIPVHIKFLNKESFLNGYYSTGDKYTIKSILLSSRLIYSKDEEISRIYENSKYTTISDKGIWNLVYLGKLLKDIGVCKKYLHKGGLYTSYEVLIRALDNFSKVYLNINGYTVSKDSLSMACNLNNTFNDKITKLFSMEVKSENIQEMLDLVEGYINNNIVIISEMIINLLKSYDGYLSSYDIKDYDEFRNFDIKVEDILKLLYKNDIVLKDIREFHDSYGNILTRENVYSYKRI